VLPLWARGVAAVALVGILFTPMDIKNYDAFGENVGGSLSWLSKNMQAGDVLLIDPEVIANTNMHEEWDLFAQMFFPLGLPLVDDPTGHQRVWYTRTSEIDTQTELAILENRQKRQFFGEITLLTQLYEAPPDVAGVPFENGMRYHGAQLLHRGQNLNRYVPTFHEDEALTVRLWWSVDAPLELDYSVGVFVLDDGTTAFSSDSAPQVVNLEPGGNELPEATSQWETGRYYVEEREIVIPDGANSLVLTVYQWWDGVRVPAPETDANDLLEITPLYVKAW
jgi:hypothetical protein